jgi:hypothetical protein
MYCDGKVHHRRLAHQASACAMLANSLPISFALAPTDQRYLREYSNGKIDITEGEIRLGYPQQNSNYNRNNAKRKKVFNKKKY